MSNSDIHSLSFLFRRRDLSDDEQEELELEKGDATGDIERNDVNKPIEYETD